MPLQPNDKFDRYTIEGLVGEGGMGRVFRAYDTRLKRRVALKVLRAVSEPGSTGGASVSRLVREAQSAASLEHPNVVAIFDVGEAEGEPFIAMELVKGRSLKSYIGDKSIPVSQKLRWLSDLASALAAAHARGIVHRDVKPSNVLIREDGVLKVFDFGIARRTKRSAEDTSGHPPDAPTLTDSGNLVGTPQYMAPEQVRNEDIDGRADQFAWGVLAFWLFTGNSPWKWADRQVEVIAAILMQPTPSLAEAVPDLAPEIVAIVERALSKPKEDRFPSMREVVSALEPFTSNAGSTPRLPSDQSGPNPRQSSRDWPPPPPPPSQAGPALDPKLRMFLAIGAGLLTAVVIGLVIRAFSGPAHPVEVKTTPDAAAPPKPVAITDLTIVQSPNAEAAAACADGMQALRDGSQRAAVRDFTRALDFDSTIAAAHLRLAIYNFFASPSEARVHFQRAVERRSTLSEHDQVLLDAMDPYVARQPPDHAEVDKRLTAAVARFPLDAELALLLAYVDAGTGESEDAEMKRYDRALALDPRFGTAYAYKAQAQAYWGDFDGAYATIAQCVRATPTGTMCFHTRDGIDAHVGNCVRMEATAMQIIAIEPQTDIGYRTLAEASYAQGKPLDAVRSTLEQAWTRTSADRRPALQAEDEFALDVLAGHFVKAEIDAKKLASLVSADASVAAHATPARELVALYTELGRGSDAAKSGADYMKHRAAWLPDPRGEDFAVLRDPAPMMLAAELRGGLIDETSFVSERDTWARTWKDAMIPHYVPFVWIHGYAAVADSPAEASRALAALPAYQPIPRYAPRTLAAADVGRTLLLAGRIDDALPYLKSATASCYALTQPIAHMRAEVTLAAALEQKGDRDGACAAYRVVLSRWGKADGKSVTAGRAKERAQALGCSE